MLNSCFISFTLKLNVANLLNLHKSLHNVSRSVFRIHSEMELLCENKHLKLESEITLESRIFTKKAPYICLTGFSRLLYGIQFRIQLTRGLRQRKLLEGNTVLL